MVRDGTHLGRDASRIAQLTRVPIDRDLAPDDLAEAGEGHVERLVRQPLEGAPLARDEEVGARRALPLAAAAAAAARAPHVGRPLPRGLQEEREEEVRWVR